MCYVTCDSGGKVVDLYFKSAIEGVVIKWTKQIDEVIKEDSSVALAKETNPTPRFGMYFLLKLSSKYIFYLL
jgi:hypothetical protein